MKSSAVTFGFTIPGAVPEKVLDSLVEGRERMVSMNLQHVAEQVVRRAAVRGSSCRARCARS